MPPPLSGLALEVGHGRRVQLMLAIGQHFPGVWVDGFDVQPHAAAGPDRLRTIGLDQRRQAKGLPVGVAVPDSESVGHGRVG